MKEFKGALLVWGRKKEKYVWNQGLVMMQCFFFAWRLNSGVWKLQIMQQKKRRQFLQECLKPFKVWSFLHPAGKNILSWPVGCSSVLRQTLYPGCVLLLQLGQEHTLESCAHTHTHLGLRVAHQDAASPNQPRETGSEDAWEEWTLQGCQADGFIGETEHVNAWQYYHRFIYASLRACRFEPDVASHWMASWLCPFGFLLGWD